MYATRRADQGVSVSTLRMDRRTRFNRDSPAGKVGL